MYPIGVDGDGSGKLAERGMFGKPIRPFSSTTGYERIRSTDENRAT